MIFLVAAMEKERKAKNQNETEQKKTCVQLEMTYLPGHFKDVRLPRC